MTSPQRVEPPALPVSTNEYSHIGSEQFKNILRLFFNRLTASVNSNITNIETNVTNIEAFGRPTINHQTGTSYTLTMADENAIILCDNANPFTLTIPPNVIPGYLSVMYQQGAGQVTLVPGSGVTLHDAASLLTRTQYSALTVVCIATDEYNVHGDME
jgi:hypothetical protein